MDILPLASISDFDSDILNLEIINLAKLKRGGLPVLEGIVVSPPPRILEKINTILDESFKKKRINLDQYQFKNIAVPEDFKKYLNKYKNLYFNGRVSSKNIWLELINNWWSEFILKYRSLQPEFDNNIELSQQIIFFLDKKNNLFNKTSKIQTILTNYDEILEDFSIISDSTFDQTLLLQIDQVGKSVHKFLTLPHNLELIIWDNRVFIIGLKPYTNPSDTKKLEKVSYKISPKNNPKSAIKVYFNLPKLNYKSFISNLKSEEADDVNCILNGEDFPNFEEKVKIIDFLKDNFPSSNIIYKFPDIMSNDISGSLRLLHQPKLLEDACRFVLFLRNKRNVGNLDIAIPLVRSVDELLKMKRELASYGLTKRNGMKLWLEVSTPENLLNIDKYLESEVDGLIINLDKLENYLIGFKIPEEQNQTLAVDVIIELLIKVFKSAHKLNTPIIISGKNYITSGLLETFISWGVYGLIVNSLIEAQSLPYYLTLLEKKLITTRLNLPN